MQPKFENIAGMSMESIPFVIKPVPCPGHGPAVRELRCPF